MDRCAEWISSLTLDDEDFADLSCDLAQLSMEPVLPMDVDIAKSENDKSVMEIDSRSPELSKPTRVVYPNYLAPPRRRETRYTPKRFIRTPMPIGESSPKKTPLYSRRLNFDF